MRDRPTLEMVVERQAVLHALKRQTRLSRIAAVALVIVELVLLAVLVKYA